MSDPIVGLLRLGEGGHGLLRNCHQTLASPSTIKNFEGMIAFGIFLTYSWIVAIPEGPSARNAKASKVRGSTEIGHWLPAVLCSANWHPFNDALITSITMGASRCWIMVFHDYRINECT